MQRVNNFENVFNINEGTTQLIHYKPYRSQTMLSKLQDLIEPELQQRDITVDLQIEETLPQQINTHFELLKTVVINTVSCVTQGAKDTILELKVAGFETEAGFEAIFEIACQQVALSDAEISRIDKVC